MIVHLSIPKTDFNCLGCGQTMGISTDMMGDVVTWLKKYENKSNELLNS